VYPRKVCAFFWLMFAYYTICWRKVPSNERPPPSDFGSILRNSLLRQMLHKATCQTCKQQFATFSSQRSIATRDLPPILAINTCVGNEEHLKYWLDNRTQTFLTPKIQIQGQLDGMDDPEIATYELRVCRTKGSVQSY
jgi:Ubiquitin carboxyl-terminal hydrolase